MRKGLPGPRRRRPAPRQRHPPGDRRLGGRRLVVLRPVDRQPLPPVLEPRLSPPGPEPGDGTVHGSIRGRLRQQADHLRRGQPDHRPGGPRAGSPSPGAYREGTGYGIVRFKKLDRTITLEFWPRYVDPTTPPPARSTTAGQSPSARSTTTAARRLHSCPKSGSRGWITRSSR